MKKTFKIIALLILWAAVIPGVAAVAIMFLWNWLMPGIAGVATIDFLQACGLFLLGQMITGGFLIGCAMLGGILHLLHSHPHGLHRHDHWHSMTDEQRREFFEQRRAWFRMTHPERPGQTDETV